MSKMEELYQYQALALCTDTRTRIFDLEPATEFHAPLVGSLREVEIKDAIGQYKALSYAWGSKIKTGAVLLDGKHLAITENCKVALQYLRLPSETRSLWVDSICINQKNREERTQQVQQMGGIFQMAAQTLLWLGKPTSGTSIAMHYLGELHARYHNPNREETADWFQEIRSNVLDEHGISLDQAILDICCLPWFQRMWTMQELLLSKNGLVVCGWDSISWAKFAAGADLFLCLRKEREGLVQCSALAHRFCFWEMFYGHLKPPKDERLVASILLSSMSQKCLLPQDKVFAVAPVVSERGLRLPSANYSLPVHEVFEELTIEYFKHFQSFYFLELYFQTMIGCPGESSDDPTWRSWVPDLRIKLPSVLSMPLQTLKPRKKIDLVLLSSRAPGTLPLKGIQLGNVIKTGQGLKCDQSSSDIDSCDWVRHLHNWLSFIATTQYCSRTSSISTDLASLILGTGELGVRVVAHKYRTTCEQYSDRMLFKDPSLDTGLNSDLVQFLDRVQCDTGETLSKNCALASPMQKYEPQITKVLHSMKLFFITTQWGVFIGLGPSYIQLHDLVVDFDGAGTLFVVRKNGVNFKMISVVVVIGYSEIAQDLELASDILVFASEP